MKKTLGILIIMVIIILSICVIKNRQVLCEKLPVRLLIVKSNSMYPTLQKGDFILIKRNNDYKKGDIITYDYESNYLVTHRIIEKNNNFFITKGDNNNSEDDKFIQLDNIKGKVILILNRKNQISIFLLMIFLVLFCLFKNNKEENYVYSSNL